MPGTISKPLCEHERVAVRIVEGRKLDHSGNRTRGPIETNIARLELSTCLVNICYPEGQNRTASLGTSST